jgi:hypothetical protein
MKVTFKRTGGFAGVARSVALDTDSMTAEDAAELKTLVASANEAPPGAVAAPRPDRLEYVITIEGEGSTRVLRAGDKASPPVQQLIDYLSGAASRHVRDEVKQRRRVSVNRHGSDRKGH